MRNIARRSEALARREKEGTEANRTALCIKLKYGCYTSLSR